MPAPGWLMLLIGALGLERVVELVIARRNERWMVRRGAREHGRGFSKVLFTFHALWFGAFIVEAAVGGAALLVAPGWLIGAFIGLQAGRYWCIASLGHFWNTKIIVLPEARLVAQGPYRWLPHPNYLIVRIELPLYPALFGCWFTAVVFGTANWWIVRHRIAQEEAALPSA